MIRTTDLSGAQLDYHTARAQGIPAERLEIRRVPRSDTLICVLTQGTWNVRSDSALPYSTDWRLAGALIEDHKIDIESLPTEYAASLPGYVWDYASTPQVAICRAVVRAAFGDEVEEVAVCER